MSQAMLKHMLKHSARAMPRSTRTYVTNERTYAESWLRTIHILAFRNARAHIRREVCG